MYFEVPKRGGKYFNWKYGEADTNITLKLHFTQSATNRNKDYER